MKKFYKVILITACILILLGGGIFGGLYIAESFEGAAKAFDKTGTFTVRFEDYEIDSVSAELTIAGIKLVKGNEWSVRFENVFSDYSSADIEGSTLKIKSSTEDDFNIFGWKIGTLFKTDFEQSPMIYVTYPEGTEFKDINLQLGLGKCIVNDIETDNMVCQTCAGSIELNDCFLNKKSAFQLLAGSFKADNVMFRNSTVKVGIGIGRINLDETSRAADVEVKTTLGYSDIE